MDLVTCFHPTMVLAQPFSIFSVLSGVQCFHPTMVLAQPSRSPGNTPGPGRVSIPLWFSLNSASEYVLIWQEAVSIPLWFSLNGQYTNTIINFHTFPSHYGSRSTFGYLLQLLINLFMFPSHYGSRSTQPRHKQPTSCLVSIPLWFSLN